MKIYQTPELVWQEMDLADILTESTTLLFGTEGQDDLTLKWWIY